MPRQAPPKKTAGEATGPRRLAGEILDVETSADSSARRRSACAAASRAASFHTGAGRGASFLIRSELLDFMAKLPGVDVRTALANASATKDGAASKETPCRAGRLREAHAHLE